MSLIWAPRASVLLVLNRTLAEGCFEQGRFALVCFCVPVSPQPPQGENSVLVFEERVGALTHHSSISERCVPVELVSASFVLRYWQYPVDTGKLLLEKVSQLGG